MSKKRVKNSFLLGALILGSLGVVVTSSPQISNTASNNMSDMELEGNSDKMVLAKSSSELEKNSLEDFDYEVLSEDLMTVGDVNELSREILINDKVTEKDLDNLVDLLIDIHLESDESNRVLIMKFTDVKELTSYGYSLGQAVYSERTLTSNLKDKPWESKPSERDIELFKDYKENLSNPYSKGINEDLIEEIADRNNTPSSITKDSINQVYVWINS